MPQHQLTHLTDQEHDLVQAIAARRGVTFQQALDELMREALLHRFTTRPRRATARVYEFAGACRAQRDVIHDQVVALAMVPVRGACQ